MAKRKSLEDSGAVIQKRRRPFTAPKNAKIKALIQQNATESPLLRLPREIRDHIWRHVFHDGRLLHIKHAEYLDDEWEKPWQNMFCVSRETPSETYTRCKHESQKTSGAGSRTWTTSQRLEDWSTHYRCERLLVTPSDDESCDDESFLVSKGIMEPCPMKEGAKFQLQLFRTCHQIYFEANEAFWSNTTFSFNHPISFRQFMTSRTTYHLTLLRKLHLELRIIWPDDLGDWNKTLSITLVRSLTSLHALHLNVEHNRSCGFLHMPGLPQAFSGSIRDTMIEKLLNFQILPLKNVTVIWQNHDGHARRFEDMSHTRNYEWAEFLRQRLLDPRGLEVWQGHKDQQKLNREREREDRLAWKKQLLCGWGNRARCLQLRRQCAEEKGREMEECVSRHECGACGYRNNFDDQDCQGLQCRSQAQNGINDT